MTTLLHCHTCQSIYPSSEAHEVTTSTLTEHFGQLEATPQMSLRCSRCGSDRLTPLHACKTCGERAAEPGTDDCDACMRLADRRWDESVRVLDPAAKVAALARVHGFLTLMGYTK